MNKSRGFSLLELVIVLALVAALVIVALPRLLHQSAGLRVRLAAGETVALLRLARMNAIRLDTHVGVKFFVEDGLARYRMYADGDGDGVRTADIRSGIDRPLGQVGSLSHTGHRVGFGFPPGRAPRDPGSPDRRLKRLDDPIRFNRSDIASFGPLGTSTPGSLYLTDHQRHLVAVRLLGLSGRVRILTWDREADRWR